jgi:conjugative transfer signal peptidase TraF
MVIRRTGIVFGAWALAAGFLILGAYCNQAGYRLNQTISMPMGWYHLTPRGDRPLKRGMLVVFCSPPSKVFAYAIQRHYLKAGPCPNHTQPLLKPVAAISGDTVILSPSGVQINGRMLTPSPVLSRDSAGRPIPHLVWGEYRIQPYEIWLISTYSTHSFDSRYFGPIRLSQIQWIATPILTEE